MIAFFDVNTVWRRKFAEALARRTPALLYSPHVGNASVGKPGDHPIRLPRGWAGPLSPLTMPFLWHNACRVMGAPPSAIVLSTPHYVSLARRAAGKRPIVYYCSDDYRSYAGWHPARMTRAEASICRAATLSIFVSEALRARAVEEYGLDPARTLVSPNATEMRFSSDAMCPPAIASLEKPVFGAAGMINSRIDFQFLNAIAEDERIGSLALVGPVEAEIESDPLLATLRKNPKVHFFGAQPHDAMHEWMASFDVAVIPYAATQLNRFCSPMRLYDHLAIGQPILATPHCAQIAAHPETLVANTADLTAKIGEALRRAAAGRRPKVETWDDRIDALQKSAVAGVLFRP